MTSPTHAKSAATWDSLKFLAPALRPPLFFRLRLPESLSLSFFFDFFSSLPSFAGGDAAGGGAGGFDEEDEEDMQTNTQRQLGVSEE